MPVGRCLLSITPRARPLYIWAESYYLWAESYYRGARRALLALTSFGYLLRHASATFLQGACAEALRGAPESLGGGSSARRRCTRARGLLAGSEQTGRAHLRYSMPG